MGWTVSFSGLPDLSTKLGYLRSYDSSAKVWIVWIQGYRDKRIAAENLTVISRTLHPVFGYPEGTRVLRRIGYIPNYGGARKRKVTTTT
ncbi:MAG: hypothetical protein JW384_03163 [Nitrosomonadaceae bacterium]|nr:hypothetical protein [Nitrosomonadaceae bacterium]